MMTTRHAQISHAEFKWRSHRNAPTFLSFPIEIIIKSFESHLSTLGLGGWRDVTITYILYLQVVIIQRVNAPCYTEYSLQSKWAVISCEL